MLLRCVQLGSSEHVQLVYDFAVGCCQDFVREDAASQVSSAIGELGTLVSVALLAPISA